MTSSPPPSPLALATASLVTGLLMGYSAFRLARRATAPSPRRTHSVISKTQEDPNADEGAKIRGDAYGYDDLPASTFIERNIPGCTDGANETLWSIFERVAKREPNAPCHGTLDSAFKNFVWETYAEVHADIVKLSKGLEILNLFGSAKNDPSLRIVGLMGLNSSNWVKAEYAIISRSGTTVPLYATLSKEGLVYALGLTGCTTVVCTTTETATRCIEVKKENPASGLRAVIVPFEKTAEMKAAAAAAKLEIVTFGELREAAAKSGDKIAPNPPKATTPFTFCFTSGSTQLPKAALLTHTAEVANVAMNIHLYSWPGHPPIVYAKEYHLSFLPLAHQLERTLHGMLYAMAGRIGFSRGDPTKIIDDVAILRPTIFPTVPRLLSRVALLVKNQAEAATGVKAMLFKLALSSKLSDLRELKHVRHPIWDALIFNKIRAKLGLDRCKIIITGSAPIPPRVLDFLAVVLCMPVIEGWGQTEITCTGTLSHATSLGGPEERPSHVGGPVGCVHLKLESIPEMEYLVSDRQHNGYPVVGRGELCVKSPSGMLGYFNDPEKTRKAIDDKGWIHTGDVAAWMPNGTLSIIDRKGNIFKTSVGEFVCPEKIERAVCRSPLVAQAFVFGTTLNAKLVAVVVPNPEGIAKVAKDLGVPALDPAEIKKLITASVTTACREAELLGYEIPGAIDVQEKPFTVDTGVLTPTFKLVRGVAKQVYAAEIKRLYKELGEEVKL